MKRSRIFMGIAALGFAGFGAFAFTTTSSSTNQAYYIPDGGGCEPFEILVPCEVGSTPNCDHPGVPAIDQKLYDEGCENQLTRETTFK